MAWYNDIFNAVSKVGKKIYSGLEDFGNNIIGGAKLIGDPIANAAQSVGDWIEGSSIYQKTLGGGASKFEQAEADWTKKEYKESLDREALWRGEDIERAEKWRQEDLERNSLAYKMEEAKKAGLHTATAAMGGAGGGYMAGAPMTRTGGRMPRQTPTTSSPGTFGATIPAIAALTSQMMNDKVTRQVMAAEARKINAEATNLETTNPYAEDKIKADIALTQALKESSDITDELTEKQIEELGHNLEKSMEMGIRTNQTQWQGMAGEMAHEAVDNTLKDNNMQITLNAKNKIMEVVKEAALNAIIPGRAIFKLMKEKKNKEE